LAAVSAASCSDLTSAVAGKTDIDLTCCRLDPVANDPKQTLAAIPLC
jgi:hypothetical protein